MRLLETPLGVRLPSCIPHWPEPPQEAFLWLDNLEALYGGAAGGGKSDALLMAALQYVHVPGYAALLFRKTYADLALPGAIMDRSKDWLQPWAKWNDNDKQWTFPSGASLTFGYLQTSNDRFRYQSAEFQMVGFDEVSQFEEVDYAYLLSRLRKPALCAIHEHASPVWLDGIPHCDVCGRAGELLSQVPLRMRAASNPGGRGHKWVKHRLIDHQPDPDDPEDTPARCQARVFIPSKLSDNPHINRAAYEESLVGLDPQTRAQLLDGDWNAREPGDWVFPDGLDQVFALGALFDRQRLDGTMRPPTDNALIVAADWGVHAHVLILWPLEAGGFYAVKEIVNDVASIKTVAPRVADEILALNHPVFSERFDASMPGLNDAFLEKLRPLLPWKVKTTAVPFGKYKALTIDYLRLLVANTAGADIAPRLAVSRHGCPILAEQIHQWKYADPDVGRTEKGDDHGPDALVAGAAPAAARRRRTTPARGRVEQDRARFRRQT
jgi:hypothetical protein